MNSVASLAKNRIFLSDYGNTDKISKDERFPPLLPPASSFHICCLRLIEEMMHIFPDMLFPYTPYARTIRTKNYPL